MTISPFRLGLFALLVLFQVASSSTAQMVTVTQDLGITQGTTGIRTSVVTGEHMGGMKVTAIFTSGFSQQVDWISLGPGTTAGGAFGTGWSLTESGDTFTSIWFLSNDNTLGPNGTGLGITRVLIDAGPGLTVFDRTFNGDGTPGTNPGLDFNVVLGLSTDNILATYRDVVAVIPNAPVGDIFRSLDIQFLNDGGFASGRTDGLALGFQADTDGTDTVLTPFAVPEPSSLVLFGVAALGLVGYRHLRRKPAA